MKIIKNGFYKLSEIKEKNIFIEDDLKVCLFDDLDTDCEISVGKRVGLDYYSFHSKSGNFDKIIISKGDDSEVKINSLFLSKNTKLVSKVYGGIFANNCKMHLNILSFALDNGDLEIDGVFEIGKSLENASGFLDEENIFIGKNAKIKALPKLYVESNDINAGHACKMERINEDDLFYLRSRGIGKAKARSIVLEAKVKKIYTCLAMYDKDFYNELYKNILDKIT